MLKSRGMLPHGYKGLVVCDTRRAHAWKAALARRGFQVVLAETAASNDRGSWEVGVIAAQELAAKAFVSEVVQGKQRLSTPLSVAGVARILVAIVLVAALVSLLLMR